MATLSSEIWWLILAGIIVLFVFIGLIVSSVLISNKKLLRVQQEKFNELRKSEKMYADLFNNVSDLVYIHQLDGTILKINQAVERLLGYKSNEIIGQKFQDVFKIPNDVFYKYIHLMDNTELAVGTFKLKARDGRELIFEYQNTFAKDIEIAGAIRGIARNVTERIKAELELKRKDALLSAVADASILLLVNPDYQFSINEVLRILGEVTEVDRVYIFENHTDPETGELLMSQKFEWCREGIEPQINNPLLQNLPYSHPYAKPLFEKVQQGQIYSGVVKYMSEPEREILEPQNIKSMLIIPIYIGKQFWGLIGFDDCTYEREWSETEIAVLKTAAGSIGGIIGLTQFEKKLQETNIFLSSILESSITISIITVDLSGEIKYWNSGAENLFGYKSNEVIGKNIVGLIVKEEDEVTRTKLYKLSQVAQEEKKTQSTEVLFYNKNGNQLWVKFTISPIINENGEVIGLSSIGEDITQRKITELALIQNEEMFRNVWENSVDGMRLVDSDARIKLVNGAFCDLVEMPYEKLIGQDYNVCYYDQTEFGVGKFKENFLNNQIPTRQVTTIKLWNGKEIPVEISNSFIEFQDNKKLLLSIFRDISEQKEYERKIRISEEKYRRLALHLQTIREEERTKIARDIHDHLGQQLTALYFEFSSIRTMRNWSRKAIEERLDGINKLIDQLIETVQRISTELRPAILDDLGLIPAIEYEISEFQKRTGIQTNLTIDVNDLKFSKPSATVIYRILQEALTNVARHSKATKVDVDLSVQNGEFKMIIKDNGIGIPEDRFADPKSIGLIGMKERAFSTKGDLQIESVVNKGTKVILTIPINGVQK
jgi:two-component system sensor histidine kinase UhpB